MRKKKGNLKLFVMLITFLLIIFILSIKIASAIVSHSTVYVCNSGCNFSSIQEAINSADPGDIVHVNSGTYYENQIIINKSITLEGDSAGNTIIDGNSATLSLAGLLRIIPNVDVYITNLKLRNAGGLINSGDGGDTKTNILIYTQSNYSGVNIRILDSIFEGKGNPNDREDYGIYSYSGKEVLIIKRNKIANTGGNSILLEKHTGPVDISENNINAGLYASDAISIKTFDGIDIITFQKIYNNTIDAGSGSIYDASHIASGIGIYSAYTGAGKILKLEIKENIINNIKSYRNGILLYNGFGDGGVNGEIVTPEIERNTLNGISKDDESIGIIFTGRITGGMILYNNFYNLKKDVVLNDKSTVYPEATQVKYNNFEESNYGIAWSGPTLLDGRYNWWDNCHGPGYNVNYLGNVNYNPWIGVCIGNMSNVPCAFKSENLKLSAEIKGSDIKQSWISYTINDTNFNKTASFEAYNRYSYTIPQSYLYDGMNIVWTFYAKDNYGRIYVGPTMITYVIKKTQVLVSPSNPDGNNDWYITEPHFDFENPEASEFWYRWDGMAPVKYTGTFGLEDAPNNGKITAGILTLRYYSNTICGKEKESSKTIYVDLTNPVIKNLEPVPNSVIYNNLTPEISAYVDEIYKNSGVDKDSIIMKIDGQNVSPEIKIIDTIDALVSYSLKDPLTPGDHIVDLELNDKSGRKSISEWHFSIEITSDFDIIINSPQNNYYNKRNILFNLSASNKLKKIEYMNLNDRNPRWTEICKNCNEYGSKTKRIRGVNEGENKIIIKASDYFGITKEKEINIFIDSKKPVITNIEPKRNAFVKGNEFSIKYTEDNLQNITLFYGYKNGEIRSFAKNCESGKNKECNFSVDLSDFNSQKIYYWFELRDMINTLKTNPTEIIVDVKEPELSVYSPTSSLNNFLSRVSFNISSDEPVIIEYIDNSVISPKWKRLCSKCTLYGNIFRKSENFSKGVHNIIIKATDLAGNSDSEEITIFVY